MPETPSDLELLQALAALADEVDRAPTQAVMAGQGEYAPGQYIDRFGSWLDALEAAGIDPRDEERRDAVEAWFGDAKVQMVEDLLEQNEPDQFMQGRLLAELMRLTVDLQAVPTIRDVEQYSEFSSEAYRSYFDSWNAALTQLDLEPHRHIGVSEDELLAEIKRVQEEVGRRPTAEEVGEHGRYSLPVYYNRFGSWSTTCEQAGLE